MGWYTAERAVAGEQALLGDALHVGQLHVAHPVAQQEVEPPVAHRNRFREGYAHRLRVAEGLLPSFEPLGLGALQLFGGDGFTGHGFERCQHFQLRRFRALPWRELGTEHRKARLCQAQCVGKGAGSKLLFSQSLVQPAGGRITHDQAEHLDRRVIGVRAWRGVITGIQQWHTARASQRDAALTILHRVERVERAELARGLLELAESLGHPAQNPLFRKLAGHDQRGVVGLVVLAVEGPQARDVDVLYVCAGADRVLAVVVPLVHGGQRLLEKNGVGAVFAALHLVAHHGHLSVQVFPSDVAVDHRIGLPAQVPAQVVVVGREAGGVVGAVEPGAAVGGEPALLEVGPCLGVLGRALEQQVLEQVGHAGLAVVLVPGPHAVGQVHRGRRLGIVGHQQHLQAILEPVFGDALHRTHMREPRGQRLGLRRHSAGPKQQNGGNEAMVHG